MCSAARPGRPVAAYVVSVLPAAAPRQLPSSPVRLREGQHRWLRLRAALPCHPQ